MTDSPPSLSSALSSSKAISISTSQPATAHHRATSLSFPLPSPSSFGGSGASPLTPFGGSFGSAFAGTLGRSGSIGKGTPSFFSTSPNTAGLVGFSAIPGSGSAFTTGSLGESAVEDEDDDVDTLRPTKISPPASTVGDSERLSPKVSVTGFSWPSSSASATVNNPSSTISPPSIISPKLTSTTGSATTGSDKFASHAAHERGVGVLRRLSLGQSNMKRPIIGQSPAPASSSMPASAPAAKAPMLPPSSTAPNLSTTASGGSSPPTIGRAGGRKMSLSGGKGVPGKRNISPHGERMLTGGLGL